MGKVFQNSMASRMTKRWSKKPPTEPGFYWWRDDLNPPEKAIIRHIHKDGGKLMVRCDGENISLDRFKSSCLWSWRITPPGE